MLDFKSQFVEMFGDIKNSKFDINSIKKLVDINIMKTKKKHKKISKIFKFSSEQWNPKSKEECCPAKAYKGIF